MEKIKLTDREQFYPGLNKDVKLQEYEDVSKLINEKYKTSSTPLQVRKEFEEAYNKLFETMLVEYPTRVFDILYVLMDAFNINETKAVQHLTQKNQEIVRSYAKSKYNTYYYEKKEVEQIKEKYKKQGKKYFDYQVIKDLFE
jgi:hypothetical protein